MFWVETFKRNILLDLLLYYAGTDKLQTYEEFKLKGIIVLE